MATSGAVGQQAEPAQRTDLVLTVIIWLIFVGLVLLSIGAGASSSGLTKAGGWVVLVFAVLVGHRPHQPSGWQTFRVGRVV